MLKIGVIFGLGVSDMKKIGIGYEFYKEFVDRDLYYVDKTQLVKDLIEKGGKVTLFTRPRRFGKHCLSVCLRLSLRRNTTMTAI